MPNTHRIKRLAPNPIGGKPQVSFMVIDDQGHVGWCIEQEVAALFEAHVAGAIAHCLRQEYEKTYIGPSYWAERAT